jgi:hypothetical protein
MAEEELSESMPLYSLFTSYLTQLARSKYTDYLWTGDMLVSYQTVIEAWESYGLKQKLNWPI